MAYKSSYRRFINYLVSVTILVAVYLFLLGPLIIVIIASFNSSLRFPGPFESISLRWYQDLFAHRQFMQAIGISVRIGVGASALATLLGVPASMVFVRKKFRGKEALNSFFMTPLIVPQIVISLALLQMFSLLHVRLSEITLLLAHTVMVIPFVLRAAIASLSLVDRSVEESAMNLGANRLQTFVYITLPLIRAGVTAGFVLSFVISFINVPLSIFLVTPGNATLPIRTLTYMETRFDPLIAAIGAISIYVILAASLFLEKVLKVRLIL